MMAKSGCTDTYVDMNKQFHDRMLTRVKDQDETTATSKSHTE